MLQPYFDISYWITHAHARLCVCFCIFLVLFHSFYIMLRELFSMSDLIFILFFQAFYMDPIILFVLQVSHPK